MTTRRIRCVQLDAEKVRFYASKKGIKTVARLEMHYRQAHDVPDGMSVGVVDKAWNGGCVDKKPATKLAKCLGLDDYVPLLETDFQSSPWKKLICDNALHERFFEFIPERDNDLRLVRFGLEQEGADLPEIPLGTRWSLEIFGRPRQELFLLLRSHERFFQLAPVDGDGFANKLQGASLRYPTQTALEFEPADGTGWRQFIAIRANRIPITHRGLTTGHECTLPELDLFALRLLNQKKEPDIAVDTYEFVLTESVSAR